MKPAAPRMRSAPAGAQRRELSKSVEFLKIGSLQQMLWPRDADAVYRFNCDSCYIKKVMPGKPRCDLGPLIDMAVTPINPNRVSEP